jgi:RNA polymerase sigma-70 factor (ECF subfamily)
VSPDAELLQAAHAGDVPSFGLLLERYRPRLLAIALRMLGYGTQAEDAVHDTFLIALRKIGTLADPGAFQPWLDTIVRNVCRMYLRRAQPLSLDARPPGTDPVAILEDPEEAIDRLAFKDWVWKALQELPESLRMTVLLRHFGRFPSYEQISQLLAIPVGTVRSRLSDARKRLSDALLGGSREADPDERVHRERWNDYYVHAFERLYEGRRDEFLSHYRPDMEVVAGRKRFLGRGKLETEVDGDLDTVTLMDPVRVYSSGDVSVLDFEVVNPPENPTRCPEQMAIVVCRTEGLSHRIYMYPGARKTPQTA